MSANYWLIIMTEVCDRKKRDILQMLALTDTPNQPSTPEVAQACSQFYQSSANGCYKTWRIGSFQPDQGTLEHFTSLPPFTAGNSKFWLFGTPDEG